MCPPGTYSEGGAAYCTPCPAGYGCTSKTGPPVVDGDDKCEDGFFADGGEDACLPCPNGVECPSIYVSATTPCDEGTYSPVGQSSCFGCPAGSYCPSPTTGEYPCPLGTYSLVNATNCTSCPPGHACPTALDVVPCVEGYYSPGGLTACVDCAPGYRCPNASSSSSPPGSACAAGTWCDPPSVVELCPLGTYGNTTAGRSVDHACAPCPPGYYCGVEGTILTTMDLCETGGYCPERSAAPTVCARGTYNAERGSTSRGDCLPCPPGFYCPDNTTTPADFPCPEGHFCAEGHSEPWPCKPRASAMGHGLGHLILVRGVSLGLERRLQEEAMRVARTARA